MKSKKKGKVDIEKQKRLENAKKVEVRAFIIFLVFLLQIVYRREIFHH